MWSEKEITLRDRMADYFVNDIRHGLLTANPAWSFHRCESSLLTPRSLINPNYTDDDVWVQQRHGDDEDLVLRPETTPGSYQYAVNLLTNHSGIKPPTVIWQHGKSFRREVPTPYRHMRLKEFYQLEFQCLYTSDTLNDYQSVMAPIVEKAIHDQLALPTRIVDSDRLPSYSLKTLDVEIDNGDKWMEVCSISVRNDFPIKATFMTKKGRVEKDIMVLEIAIGMDRCVYNWIKRTEKS